MEGLGVLFVVGVFGFYLIILPILVFTTRGRLKRLEADAAALHEELATLRSRTAAASAAATSTPSTIEPLPGVEPHCPSRCQRSSHPSPRPPPRCSRARPVSPQSHRS